MAQLGAQLLHGELGLEVFGEFEALHEHLVAPHHFLHAVDIKLFALPIELAVFAPELHQLLVILEQALGLVLNDFGFKERHGPGSAVIDQL